METNKIAELFKKYNLTSSDYYKHNHYQIITRQGIDKIQAIEKMFIEYDVVTCEPEFCAVKAKASKDNAKIETFGSAKYGGKEWDATAKGGKGGWNEKGNTTTWYVMEMAEKRAMSRAVLKLCGFYELGVFGEDESEDFKKENKKTEPNKVIQMIADRLIEITNEVKNIKELKGVTSYYNSLADNEKTNKAVMKLLKDKQTDLKQQ